MKQRLHLGKKKHLDMLRNQNTWLGLAKDGLSFKTLSRVIYEMHV